MYEADDLNDDVPPDDTAALTAVPDLAGLPVEDATGLCVGELYGALVETETGLVRYIDLALTAQDRHVLVPIGHARVRERERDGVRIRLRAAMLEELEQIPPFAADVSHVDDPFERALLEAYGRSFHGERYYAHPSYDHNGVFVGDHPIVGNGDPAPDADAGPHAAPTVANETPDEAADEAPDGAVDEERGPEDAVLRRLSYLPGWRIARGEHDIRGWPLVLHGNARVLVRDLIVEPAAGQARYVIIDTPDQTGSRLLPLGFLQIDADAGVVTTDCLTADDVVALPAYDGGGVTRPQEDRLRATLMRRISGRRRYLLPDYQSCAEPLRTGS
jgi:hypothetical protein